MAKTGRNDPCPCGSGNKYKRCCLEKDEAAASAATRPVNEAAVNEAPPVRMDDLVSAIKKELAFNDDIDEASNAVVDLVHAGKLDEAEQAARDLLEHYPDVHDGYDRLGMVYEARGDKKQAAAYYRKIVEFVSARQPRGYDPQIGESFRRLADELDPPVGT
jgi:tetratricopeptide (TPR) repeat protein